MDLKLKELSLSEKKIIDEVWGHKTEFVQWPTEARLLWGGCVRAREHYKYPDDLKKELKSKGITADTRMVNGPAITAFLFAGGKRPKRTSNPSQEWPIHHIYDGNFPWPHPLGTLGISQYDGHNGRTSMVGNGIGHDGTSPSQTRKRRHQ